MNLIDEYLEKRNLKLEDLSNDEKQTLYSLIDATKISQLSVEKIKDSIQAMKNAVEQVLVDEPEYTYIFIFKVLNRKHVFLKARLKNYMLLEFLLNSPERAKKALDKSLDNLKTIKK